MPFILVMFVVKYSSVKPIYRERKKMGYKMKRDYERFAVKVLYMAMLCYIKR